MESTEAWNPRMQVYRMNMRSHYTSLKQEDANGKNQEVGCLHHGDHLNIQESGTRRLEDSLTLDVQSESNDFKSNGHKTSIAIALVLLLLTALIIAIGRSFINPTNQLSVQMPTCNPADDKRMLKPMLLDITEPRWNFCGPDPVALIMNNRFARNNRSEPSILCETNVKTVDVLIGPFLNGDFSSLLQKFSNLESFGLLGPANVEQNKEMDKIMSRTVLPIEALRFVDVAINDVLFEAVADRLDIPCLQKIGLDCVKVSQNGTELGTMKNMKKLFPSLGIVEYLNTEYPHPDINYLMNDTDVEFHLLYKECY